MKLGGWMITLTVMCLFLALIGLNIPGVSTITDAAGITINNESAQITDFNFQGSSIWQKLFGLNGLLLLVSLGSVITAGLYVVTKDKSILILPFLVLVAGIYISTFISIVLYVETGWMKSLVGLIFGGLGVGFFMSILDYFTNN